MVAIPFMFNPRDVTPVSGAGTSVPNGWYKVVAIASELKPTTDNSGQYIQFDYKCIDQDSPYNNTVLNHRLNVQNKNETAMRIALQELSAICHAVGMLQQLQDTSQLHNIPFMVHAEQTFDDQGRTRGNNFRQFADAAGNVVGRSGMVVKSGPTGSHSTEAKPPQPQQQPQPATQAGGAWGGQQAAQQPQPQPQPQGQTWAPPQGQQPAPQQPQAQPQPNGQGWGQPNPAPQPQPQQQAPQQPPQGQPAAWGQPQGQQPAPQPNGAGQPAAWGGGQQAAPQPGGAPAWGAPR